MPVSITKLKDGRYQVRTPTQIHGKHLTLKNAVAQKLILERSDKQKRLGT